MYEKQHFFFYDNQKMATMTEIQPSTLIIVSKHNLCVALRGIGVFRRLNTEKCHVFYFTTLILLPMKSYFGSNSYPFESKRCKDMTISIADHAHLPRYEEIKR